MAETRKYISMEELKTHNKKGDLWISIQGRVLDVSDWAKNHPGGELPLMSLAGQDATDAFIAYHPSYAWQLLDKFSNGYYLKDFTVSEASKDYRRLVYEFSRLNLFKDTGYGVFISLFVMAMLFVFSVYGVVFCQGFWIHLLCGGFIGLLWIQSGWIGHDSGHYQVMPTPNLNRFVQILTGNCLTGLSMAWWKRNHNAHHIACNSLDYDPDLQHMPLFAVSSKFFHSLTSYFYDRKMVFNSACRFLVSNQHWTFYPVMGFARINLLAQSLILLLSKRNVVPFRKIELLGVVVFFTWYPLLLSCLPNWGERLAFFAASFMVTGIQHVQFCLNHFSSDVYVGPPTGHDWFEKQTSGSLNIECSPWMDWFHGGLQFQIEHHLFPRLPHSQLRKVSPFVKDLCKKHGLPYNSATFLEANMMTLKTLRNAALQARDLSNPMPKNLVWEAFNNHG